MKVTGWGKYPAIKARSITPQTISAVQRLLGDEADFSGIARGLGRSYGDSSLAENILNTRHLDHLLAFDAETGVLRCAAGASLDDILSVFVSRGWFLPTTPGTKFITVAGAIASDVHGKNHHVSGCFSQHILSFRLALASGEVVECSPEQHPELFRATCGGMGLTGIIVEATLRLKPIRSASVVQTTIKAGNLQESMALMDEYRHVTYSVAWIDCLTGGKQLGRSLLTLGEHAEEGPLVAGAAANLKVPVDLPGMMLNRYSIQTFNTLYYNRVRKQQNTETLHYEPFFYPLDGIHHWNRMYGKNGFTQYQFVLPREAGFDGMKSILRRIAHSRRGSFLAVLKAFGPSNDNTLSFPMEGYTLALDFKLDHHLFPLLDELDELVLGHGGRLYLAKDSRMSEATFKRSYPQWEAFQAVRQQYGADQRFHSLQSKRLGL